ncbi:MAG: DUF924 family protein [Candidatus Wenzhouxiangella sp. M2_3B_020]
MSEYRPVLDFWFGEDADRKRGSEIAGAQSGLWWGKDADTDREMRERFEPLVQAAGSGKLDDWKRSPEGWLALILLTDQFPRNIYRDTPKMFRFDDVARELCIEGIETGIDVHLEPIQRVFFYMPLEHSENADDQSWCVDLMHGLARAAENSDRKAFEGFVEFAEAHRRIIDRFGRFPHRNTILGRESSEEELEFLREPGSSF